MSIDELQNRGRAHMLNNEGSFSPSSVSSLAWGRLHGRYVILDIYQADVRFLRKPILPFKVPDVQFLLEIRILSVISVT